MDRPRNAFEEELAMLEMLQAARDGKPWTAAKLCEQYGLDSPQQGVWIPRTFPPDRRARKRPGKE